MRREQGAVDLVTRCMHMCSIGIHTTCKNIPNVHLRHIWETSMGQLQNELGLPGGRCHCQLGPYQVGLGWDVHWQWLAYNMLRQTLHDMNILRVQPNSITCDPQPPH